MYLFCLYLLHCNQLLSFYSEPHKLSDYSSESKWTFMKLVLKQIFFLKHDYKVCQSAYNFIKHTSEISGIVNSSYLRPLLKNKALCFDFLTLDYSESFQTILDQKMIFSSSGLRASKARFVGLSVGRSVVRREKLKIMK